MTYSGLNNGPTDFLSSSQLGGGSDEPLDFIPTSVLGGASDESVFYIPSNVLGGFSDQAVPAYTASELTEPPRTQVAGKSYTQPQRDVVYRVQPAALSGVGLLNGSSFALYVAVAPYSLPVEAVILVCTAASGVTADATASLETNTGVAFTGPVVLSQFRQVGDVFSLRPINALTRFVAPGDGIRLVINSPATGSVLTADAYLLASLIT